MATPLKSHHLATPGRGYAWACLFGDQFQITYLYGPARTCREIGVRLVAGQYQHKGRCATLAEARSVSEAAAAVLKECYGGVDGARVVCIDDYPGWRPRLGLLRRQGPEELLGTSRRADRGPTGF